MIEVLAEAVAAQFVAWLPEIWTDCISIKTSYTDVWATITGHKVNSLCFEALQRAQQVMTSTKVHPEKRTEIRENWTLSGVTT